MSRVKRWCAAAAVWLLAACGSWPKQPERPTRGQVFAAIAASTAPDEDGDGLPNDVERRFQAALGTDLQRADCDGDGLDDSLEVFGASWLYAETRGRAGALAADAPAGRADDPTRSHAAELVDSDDDGVPDYLEYVGYRHDWRVAGFVLDRGGHRTDPLQWSTDQDAYSDGQEVSKLGMDVAVRPPGDHPLVPAYPDVVIELTGYRIALNEQITDGSGAVLESGTEWSREVSTGHSWGTETGVGAEAGFELGKESKFSFKASVEKKWTRTDTSSEAVTTGGHFTEQLSWDRARSYSPAEAARIKLFVRVHNRGTAPASNLVPTINVRVGGADLATFEAAQVPIHMLPPGATYPADPGVSLVLDRDQAGNPLTLTDWELRALQSRAPITLSVTQKRADVMRLEGGAWERVGDVNEYLARILSVSASLFLDVGKLPETGEQARLAQRLVYAGQGPAAPRVSMYEALGWTDGFDGDPGAGYALRYQRDDGTTATVLLKGTAHDDRTWRCEVDPLTMEHNFPHGAPPGSLEQVLNLQLLPGSQVSLRAPRPEAARLPVVHTAYALPTDQGYEIVACASDYDAIDRVVFVDKNQREVELRRDGRGPWFYAASIGSYAFRTVQDAAGTTPEVVRVDSVRKDAEGAPIAAIEPLEVVYTPTAQPPILRRVTYEVDAQRFYARVEPGGPLPEDEVDWVRLYHPALTQSTTGGGAVAGYRSLATTIYAFEDPYGWEVAPVPFLPGMRLVAHTRGGRYTSRDVDDLQNLAPFRSGTVWLRAGSDWDVFDDDEYWTPEVDLDAAVPQFDDCGGTGLQLLLPGLWVVSPNWASCVANDPRAGTHWIESSGFLSSNPAQVIWDWWPALTGRTGLPDLYVRTTGVDTAGFVMGFHVAGTTVADLGGLTGAQYYDGLDYNDVLGRSGQLAAGPHGGGSAEAYRGFGTGTVALIRTTEGRLGKLYVRQVFDLDEATGPWSFQRNVELDYVVYRKAGDGRSPDDMAYAVPDAVYAVGQEIEPNAPTTRVGDPPDEYLLCAAAGTPCLPEQPTLLPRGLVFSARTGALTGTPLEARPRTEYVVHGTNSAGATQARLWFTVLSPPAGLAYAPPDATCPTGQLCRLTPTVTGDVDAFSIAPPLPAGLTLNRGTGELGGRPTEVTARAEYRVTAANRAGSSVTVSVFIATPLGPPLTVRYPSATYAFTVDRQITEEILPIATGGAASSYAVAPPLPEGLRVDPDTGRLWGTPTRAAAEAAYVVTAANAAGQVTTALRITVQAGGST